MPETNTQRVCSKPGCEVTTTGQCAEGHEPLEACSSYGHELTEVPAEEREDDSSEKAAERSAQYSSPLPTGEALNIEDVDEFLRWRPASRITIVGDRDSGKTTFICSIYDQFLRGPFADHIFAGSRTLVALEKRSHFARIESGKTHPDTPHTSMSDGLKYLHLAASPKACVEERSDLMFSDRAGETYKLARSNSEKVSELSEFEQSDRIVILLDGGRVANAVERAGAIQAVRQMLRALIDGDALGPTSIVQIVTTKIDLFVDHPEKQAIESQLDAFQKRLISDFADRLADLSFWNIAARDPAGNFETAHGVDDLFSEWITCPRNSVPRATLSVALSSEFDQLLFRTPMEALP